MNDKQLILENIEHLEGTFLEKLREGYFDLQLFNEILEVLIFSKKNSGNLNNSIAPIFGLFAFHCIQHIYQQENNNGTSNLVNFRDVNIPKVIDSLHWCLNAMIYDKNIDSSVLIRPFPGNPPLPRE